MLYLVVAIEVLVFIYLLYIALAPEKVRDMWLRNNPLINDDNNENILIKIMYSKLYIIATRLLGIIGSIVWVVLLYYCWFKL